MLSSNRTVALTGMFGIGTTFFDIENFEYGRWNHLVSA